MVAALFLTWDQIDRSAPQTYPEEVVLRGFVYQAKNGDWILSPEPNLRSCCVGAAHKNDQQIVLQGDFSKSPSHQVINVKGQLSTLNSGQIQKIVMQNPSVYTEETSFFYTILILFGIAIFCMMSVFLLKKRC